MSKKLYFLIIPTFILTFLFAFLLYKNSQDNQTTDQESRNSSNLQTKLLPPPNNKIYFGAFPDFGGPEDQVSKERIEEFKKLAGRDIAWAYFSQNWFNGIEYPKDSIHAIEDAGAVPFVRLMPRSDEEQFKKEQNFNLQNIIDGKFDNQLRQWARDSKQDFEETHIPLLVDFAVEPNGNWFSWSGVFNGGGTTDEYGDPGYPDGPEKYRDAYRHIIDIFKQENVTHISWFFHSDIYSTPQQRWNDPKYYYPGDDYIDWIGFSIYGPQNPDEDYWETFSAILEERHQTITDISDSKPIAVLEFGVTDNHPFGDKAKWLDDAFATILDNPYFKISAISYWHENWEEEDNLFATIRVDSSTSTLQAFQKNIKNDRFVSKLQFSDLDLAEFYATQSDQNQFQPTWYQPKPGISWQWQLGGEKVNTKYNVDLYDIDLENTSKETIDYLHRKGSKVICYFNAGAYEPYRSDSKKFPKSVLGKVIQGWEDERWLDIAHYEKFADIMEARLDLAVKKGCDGVEPDNIHAYQEDTGLVLTYADQIKYNRWLATQAHKRGLAIALKNDGPQVKDLVNDFDFAIVEECFQYDECQPYIAFIKQNKAVLEVEYELPKDEFCSKAKQLKFSALKMNRDLDGGRDACE